MGKNKKQKKKKLKVKEPKVRLREVPIRELVRELLGRDREEEKVDPITDMAVETMQTAIIVYGKKVIRYALHDEVNMTSERVPIAIMENPGGTPTQAVFEIIADEEKFLEFKDD